MAFFVKSRVSVEFSEAIAFSRWVISISLNTAQNYYFAGLVKIL